MMIKTKRYNVRVSEKDKKTLEILAEKLDIPAAQIVRDAVRERIAILSKQIVGKTEQESVAVKS